MLFNIYLLKNVGKNIKKNYYEPNRLINYAKFALLS